MARDTDLKGFEKKVRGAGKQIEPRLWRLMRIAALSIHREVVMATPVDTGRARSNWRVGIGQSPRKVIEPFAPGRKLGRGESANAQAAIDAAQQKLNASGTKPKTIFIRNNVHYIGKLNAGTSPQAPADFVLQAVLAGILNVQDEFGEPLFVLEVGPHTNLKR